MIMVSAGKQDMTRLIKQLPIWMEETGSPHPITKRYKPAHPIGRR